MILIILLTLFIIKSVSAQTILFPTGMPEHGFLPGKKFQYYPTIHKYDFSARKLRVEVYDDRQKLNLTTPQCSDIEFTNSSEFANPGCIYKIGKYIDTLFKQAGATIDVTSSDTLQVRLEGIDARLIGFGFIRAHGLCQIKMKYHNITKTYCVDITDADEHSPVNQYAFVTRLTATRIMASASIREVIEKFFVDLKIERFD